MSTPSTLFADIREELATLEAHARLRKLRATSPLPGVYIDVAGRRMLDLSSNDYLGFASNVEMLARFQAEQRDGDLGRCSGGSTASRLLSGNRPVADALEGAVGQAYGRTALLFNSGYHANIGTVSALAGQGDLVLLDRLCHASIIDGVRLSGARWLRYRHGDMQHLESLLQNKVEGARRIFVVSESIFSMDGDCADVSALVRLKEQYGAVLILDEAHAVGVRGSRGLGVAEEAGLLDRVDILVGTLGKAYGSMGAFVVASEDVCSYLINSARSFIFSTGLPPHVHAWSLATWHSALEADSARMHLRELAARFREALVAAGIRTGGDSQIVPVIVGSDAAAVATAAALQAEGYWVLPIRPPTVPPNTARLRFTLCANMQWDALAPIIPVIKKALSQ